MESIKDFYKNLSFKKKEKIFLIIQIFAWLIWAWLSWRKYEGNEDSVYGIFFYSSMLLSIPLVIKLLKFNILETPNFNKSLKRICFLFFSIGILNMVFSLGFGYYQRRIIDIVDSNAELNKLKEDFEKKCPSSENNLATPVSILSECISILIKSEECKEKYRKELEKILEEVKGYDYETLKYYVAPTRAGQHLEECNFSFLHNKLNLPDYKRTEEARWQQNGDDSSDREFLKKGILIAGVSVGIWLMYILIPFLFRKFKIWFNKE